ncbi:MAG: amino acid adenylation domain-containing protein [Terriglobales bacterium]
METISTSTDQPILTESERQQVLVEWNNTAAEYPRDRCVHQLVERQAERTPSTLAVKCGGQTLTYRELNSRANQLACYLSKLGVGPEVPVGIFLDRSLDLAITLLAVLKSGGTCVPLDPQYPGERLAFMLEDAQVAALVTDENLLGKIDSLKAHTVCLGQDWNAIKREKNQTPVAKVTPDNLAYIVYTSGSTGKPRGVQLPHRGLVNHHVAAAKIYGLQPSDLVLQFSSISFDISIEEIFPTWVAGGTVVFRTDETPLAASGFLRWIGEQQITVLNLPTAYWHELVHELSESSAASLPESLRMVIVGGEKASATAFSSWLRVSRGKVRWVNTYGPTEASVIATAHEPQISSPEQVPASLPIGRPIANTQIYLLDPDLNPVPVGEEGELHIGGDGVARGYLNRPEMTAEKFIADPFSTRPGARLYKTGDLARYLPSGEIEFAGRRDFQVKIRGFRVELGEIEAVLATHPGIRDAVVVAIVDRSEDKRLLAYVIPVDPSEIDTRAWRSFLEERLPDYMVPSLFVTLEALPLTPNGKVDRRALEKRPVNQTLISRTNNTVASDPIQKQLIKLWQSVLGIDCIGLQDNFWELGGHSLLAARLTQLIENTFGKRMTLVALIEAPTVEQLALMIKDEDKATSWSCLVPLQPGNGTKPPFFCIHGVGGNSVGFRDLANFVGTDQPFYGVQAQGLDGQLPCLTRVEDMAALYLKEIRNIQPSGPYYLGGFSFGGWIAYEMAQQLQAQGEEVGLIALFDTYPFRLRPVTSSLLSFFRIPTQQQLMYVLPKTIKKGIRRRIVWVGLPRAIKNVLRACYEAERQYQLRPYSGRVTLFRATEALTPENDPHARWRELARGGVEIQEIEGHHADIILEPQVRITAAKLRACLERARREYSSSRSDNQLSQVAD